MAIDCRINAVGFLTFLIELKPSIKPLIIPPNFVENRVLIFLLNSHKTRSMANIVPPNIPTELDFEQAHLFLVSKAIKYVYLLKILLY
jgi:hypothetical protein